MDLLTAPVGVSGHSHVPGKDQAAQKHLDAIGRQLPVNGEITRCDQLARSCRPEAIRFVDTLPRGPSATIIDRAGGAAARGQDPGDPSTFKDPAALDAIRAAR